VVIRMVCVCVYYCRTFYKAVRVGEEESGVWTVEGEKGRRVHACMWLFVYAVEVCECASRFPYQGYEEGWKGACAPLSPLVGRSGPVLAQLLALATCAMRYDDGYSHGFIGMVFERTPISG
jgi:hypothetical protein